MQSYNKLEGLFRKLYNLEHLASLGDWDMNVNMPPKGAEARGEALATISEIIHSYITAPEVKTLLDEAAVIAQTEMSTVQQANLREMHRAWRRENALPAEFVTRKARLTTKAHNMWKDSRAENNFEKFLPCLKELVDVAREEGSYLAKDTNYSPYEALMNQYEPGITTARLDALFNDVKSWLPSLIREIVEQRKSIDASIIPIKTPISHEKQQAMAHFLMKVWKFDFDGGRLDVSPHPFTGMTKEDCRITTHYHENDPFQSIFSVIHETGHAKYEMNCGPEEMIGQPVCQGRSLGVHESQSRFQEVIVGHSTAFAHFLAPHLNEYFGKQDAFTVENVEKMLHRVKPGYIRIEADEVCYSLHVILRYEIERALIEGTMEAVDVPRVWNEKMQEYLGLDTQGRDDLGCLQDIHWAMGSLGYFPTYAIGSMFAAQLMDTIKQEIGEDTVEKCIRNGELQPIFDKQREKIWSKGCLLETEELMIKATGEPLNAKHFKKYLENRYLPHKAN